MSAIKLVFGVSSTFDDNTRETLFGRSIGARLAAEFTKPTISPPPFQCWRTIDSSVRFISALSQRDQINVVNLPDERNYVGDKIERHNNVNNRRLRKEFFRQRNATVFD
jgi:hypothetical protein